MSIEALVADYLAAVEKCLGLFQDRFGRRDLIRAWREGVIEQVGELSDGIIYQMHGVGCSVEFSDIDLDFDFASSDEVGFDTWRLTRFAKQFPGRYKDCGDQQSIGAGLSELIDSGVASRLSGSFPGETNESLLVLTKGR